MNRDAHCEQLCGTLLTFGIEHSRGSFSGAASRWTSIARCRILLHGECSITQ
jgi:hypothetical protein